MPLYRASVATARADVLAGTLAVKVSDQFRHTIGHRAPDAEVTSWTRSLDALTANLIQAGLDDVELLVEHQLPLTSKRADVILAGTHPKTGAASFVVIELKQWSEVEAVEDAPDLCYVAAYGRHPVLHPAEQVRRYCTLLSDFTRAYEHAPDAFAGAAYLHNATRMGVDALLDLPEDSFGRLFTGDHKASFYDFLRSRLAPAPGIASADALLASKIAPSRQLLAVAAEEVQQRETFTLLDEQQVAYRLVLRAVERAKQGNRKTAVIVSGGPGSGKSVIALSLLGEMFRRGWSAVHATGSKSFTETLRRVAGKRNTRVKGLFKYFNSFIAAEANDLDVLICDEAHRIRETSANRYTRAEHRTGRSQVEELIDASRVPVFLLDEHQVVRPGELGTVDSIAEAARRAGLEVEHVALDAQFRCGGSRLFEEWVLRLLGLNPDGPVVWECDERFVLATAESPAELEQTLAARLAEGFGARMTAGFAWPWSDPRPDGSLVDDVVVGDWRRPWNLKGDRAIGGAPPSSLWATDPAGFGQVGCVYTAQGFEYDWNGVIFGPDLVWRGDRWVAQRDASKDPSFRGLASESIEPLLKNVYKVLLTRGMAGTIVYSVDPETQQHLESLVPSAAREPVDVATR